MTSLLLLLGALFVAQPVEPAAPALYDDYVYQETHRITALDEHEIVFHLDHPTSAEEKVPLLVMIDGSGCVGQLRPNFRYWFRPGPGMPAKYARLQVEKQGVEPDANWGAECSAEFHTTYGIDDRVDDHLRVLQHLAAKADWWNGEIYVWGWSDGGDIGAQLIIARPDVERAVLGAMGGGLTMAEHFEQFWACAPEMTDDTAGCRESLGVTFADIRDNPSRSDFWSGDSKYTWNSRLFSRLVKPLEDNRVPLLIVHGELDRNATPVESARILVEALNEAGNDQFAYWEIAGMGHTPGKLPSEQKTGLRLGMLQWLFDVDTDGTSLPEMTDRSIIRPLSASAEAR